MECKVVNLRPVIKKICNSSTLASLIINHALTIFSNNDFKIQKGNLLKKSNSRWLKTKVEIKGTNNRIIIEENVRFNRCSFFICGDNNVIEVGRDCNLTGCNFWIEDNNNKIILHEKISVSGETQLASIEGCKIIIGKDCMISSDIVVRTGDSHSIINQGLRINPSKDVIIEEHCWIGSKSIINKGTIIPKHCIVGSGSVVTKPFDESNSIIAGNPARIIKRNIDWIRDRI